VYAVVQAAPAPATTYAVAPPARTSYVDDALDADVMRALNGAKRKRTLATIVVAFVFCGLAALVTLAIVSQATHGR
jgi:hypothetical protein